MKPRAGKPAVEAVWVLGLNGLQVMLSAVGFIKMATVLGPAEYGAFTFVFTLATFAPLLAGVGGDHVFIMQGSRLDDEVSGLFANAFVVRAVGSTVILGGVAAAWAAGTWNGGLLLTVTAGTLTGAFAFPLATAYYRVCGAVRFPMIVLNVGQALFVAGLFAAGRELDSLRVAGLYLAAQALGAVVLLADIVRRTRLRPNSALLRRHAGLGGWFSVSQLVDLAFARMDVLLVQALAGQAAVGLYGAGFRFVGALTALPSAVHIVYLSHFHRTASEPDALRGLFDRTRAVLIELGAFVLGAVAAASWRLVDVFLGAAYAASAPVTAVSALGMLVVFATYPYSMLVEAEGRVALRLALRCAALLAAGLLTAALTWRAGIVGAATGVAGGALVSLVLLHMATRSSNLGLGALLRSSGPALVAVAAATAVAAAGPVLGRGLPGLCASVAVYGVMFVAALNLLGIAVVLDLRVLAGWVRRGVAGRRAGSAV